MISLICGILKQDTSELIYEIVTGVENKLRVTSGESGEGRIIWESGIDTCTLVCVK